MEEINKGIEVAKALKQLMETLRQNLHHQFKGMNITAPQGLLIGILARHGKMKVSDLSEKLGLSNSTVSGIIDRLENQGFVERSRSEEDRRVVYVDISPEFKKVSQKHRNEVEKVFETMISKASEEELDVIFKGLDTLKRVFERSKE